MPPSEFHDVAIPTEDLEAVYQLLGERSKIRDARGRSEPHVGAAFLADSSERSDAKDAVWTEDLLERVAQGDTVTTQVLTDIMDVIARDTRGSHEYNREELVEETGHSAGRVTNIFTKLSPHFRKRYGTEWWPVMGESGANFSPVRSGTYYWMTPAITDRWKRIRSL